MPQTQQGPGRRWQDSDAGIRVADEIRARARAALAALDAGARPSALELLAGWDRDLDTAAMSAPAHFSISAALADAHHALSADRPEDARAFIQAATSMLR